MRMFAGPNGSGKSSLKTLLNRKLLGTYINPDEIEATMRADSQIDLRDFGANGSGDDILAFLGESSLIKSAGLRDLVDTMSMSGDKLLLGEMPANSYLASVISDFVRHRLLEQGGTFTFETVMSHPGKVALLKHAQQLGYRTYLYYVATGDPLINISRVENRVILGGHAVPHDKIVERYHRSLELLLEAIGHTDRAYIFDNSGEGTSQTFLAEITGGTSLELKSDIIPIWFRNAVLTKFTEDD